MMHKRKSYHKVRGGCFTCKERKVRCGLERPVCHNCNRLERRCVYPNSAPENHTVQSLSSHEDFRLVRVIDLELMHHYTAYTYRTISNVPILVSLWKEAVPSIAFQHSFLLRGLLAIAAQHKLYLGGITTNSKDIINTANLYQQEALETYIQLLNSITEQNCHALFAFSQIIVGISYSRLGLDINKGGNDVDDLITKVIGIFDLLKGCLTVSLRAAVWLRAGDLEPMLRGMPKKPQLEQLSADGPSWMKSLSALSDYIVSQADDSAESRARTGNLLSGIQFVATLFIEDPRSEHRVNHVLGLPLWLDPGYLNLLRQRDHAALTILAYYSVALHQLSHWIVDSVGAKIVHTVAEEVGCDWSQYLLWPQMEIRGEHLPS